MVPGIIDIEASGFGRGSYPIEVGLVLPDGETHCHIIRPDDSWTHWDKSAEAVHGIERDLLLQKGLAPMQVAGELNRLLAGRKIYTDAWSYDISWLGKLYDLCGLPQLYQLESLRALMSEAQAALWHAVKEQVANELRLTRHRASTDALILQKTFSRTLSICCGATACNV